VSRSELLQLMAAQIFAGMASQPVGPAEDKVMKRAEMAVRAAKAIADLVTKSGTEPQDPD
jgi:hypothetical protein